MLGTMQTAPLNISRLLLHGSTRHAAATIVGLDEELRPTPTRFDVIGARCAAFAHALTDLGVGQGDGVGTVCGNQEEHLEVLLAVPSMGAIAHPVNVRLDIDYLVESIRLAGDTVLVVDPHWSEILLEILERIEVVHHVVFLGASVPDLDLPEHVGVHTYEGLLDGRPTWFPWPEVDENDAAVIAFTSGTTGEPKGVAFSHRSIWLHSMEMCMAECAGLWAGDTVLVTVPLFHVMSWGLPYAAFMSGASLVLARSRRPDPLPSGTDVAALLASQRPSKVATTPIVWLRLLRRLEKHPQDIGYLKEVLVGGSSVPSTVFDTFADRHNVTVLQAFGLTEANPMGAVARPDPLSSATRRREQRLSQGRFPAGVEARLVDQGRAVPHDGSSLGELQLRGPWVAVGYVGAGPDEDNFDDGWLRTGDMAAITPEGFLRVADRVDDVIPSGGEWISSVELENAVMLDPRVAEAACVGVEDERWGARPLVVVRLKQGATATARSLWNGLEGEVDLWKRPDHWAFVDSIPRTSVGKFDKRAIRARNEAGEYEITTIRPGRSR